MQGKSITMIKNFRAISLLGAACLAGGLMWGGCGSDSNENNGSDNASSEEKISVDLYMRYLEDEQLSKVTASFTEISEDGKKTPYVTPLKMWFQGRAMDPLPAGAKEGAYQLELDRVSPDIFEYVIEVKKNKTEKVELDMNKKTAPAILDFSLTSGLKVDLAKLPLGENDNLVVVVTDVNNASSSMTITGPFRGTAILSVSNFAELTPGPVDLYLVWKGQSEQKIGSFDANVEMEYYFNKISVELED